MTEIPGSIGANTPDGQRLNHLYELAKHVRGAFMDQAIWIDVIVTDILAQYFAPDTNKRMLLSSDVIAGPDASFSSRIRLLQKILLRSYTSFAQEFPKLCDQLDKIRRFRNRLAHAHLDTSDAFMSKGYEDRIQLVFFEDGSEKTQMITIEESNVRLKECSDVVRQLLALQALVRQASTT
jgi:hypothetical protein